MGYCLGMQHADQITNWCAWSFKYTVRIFGRTSCIFTSCVHWGQHGCHIYKGGLYWGSNTLRPKQTVRHFPDDIFKCIFLDENIRVLLKISLTIVTKVRHNNTLTLVQIIAWLRTGDTPLLEPMMVSLLMHICVSRPQWVNDKTSAREAAR